MFGDYETRLSDNHTGPRVYASTAVVMTPIQGAARLGYLDAIAGRGFSPEWEIQQPQWQRNYESGRLWGAATKSCGMPPIDWLEGGNVPGPLLHELELVRQKTGSGTRPEDFKSYDRPKAELYDPTVGFSIKRNRRPRKGGF